MKLKNNYFLLIILVLILSSCNQEESKFVLSQNNFSYNQYFEVYNTKTLKTQNTSTIDNSFFNNSEFINKNYSLSYGASFTDDKIEINQIKISNNLFHWTFIPDRFDDNNNSYFGNKNLVFPNSAMLSESLKCEIFLKDGTLINDSIPVGNLILKPLDYKLSLLDDYILIVPIKGNQDKIGLSSKINIDLSKAVDIDLKTKNLHSTNSILKFYKNNEILYQQDISLNPTSNYYLFKSSYLKECDAIYLAMKSSNNTLSGNIYNILDN